MYVCACVHASMHSLIHLSIQSERRSGLKINASNIFLLFPSKMDISWVKEGSMNTKFTKFSSRFAYHCEYKTTAMLCSSGAKNNWQCKFTAVIRRQPCSVAVAPKLSHLSHQCKPCSVAMAPGSSPLLFSVCSVCCMLCRRAHLFGVACSVAVLSARMLMLCNSAQWSSST